MKNTQQPGVRRDVPIDPLDRGDLLARDERDERFDTPDALEDQEDQDDEKHEGDVLGLGSSDPDVRLPKPRTSRKRPRGIEVRTHATGIGDVPQRAGATGIDMGHGGEGTHIDPSSDRPADEGKDE